MQVLHHGNEIFNFFTIFNFNGFLSIFIFSFLMFFSVFKILNIRLKYNINNYSDFIAFLDDKFNFFNFNLFLFIIDLFLAITFYIMLVGFSTLFNYQFGIYKIIPTLIIIIICYNIFKNNNLKFIYIINTILIPILIAFLTFLCLTNIKFNPINIYYNYNNIFYAIFKGILYFSYNSLIVFPILFTVKIKNNKNNFLLSLFFSSIILLLTFLLNMLLLSFFENIKNLELPILAICNLKNKWYTFFYFFIVQSAILTTMFSAGFSFINNIKLKSKKNTLIIFLLFSFVFIIFSFSSLINFLYPFFGLLGLSQIFLILLNKY